MNIRKCRPFRRRLWILGAALVALVGFSFGALAQTLTILHPFTGGSTDGAYPLAGLIADASGNLYGTTQNGGSSNCYGSGCGTIFKVTPTGSETVLYAFAGGTIDGAYPAFSGLIADTSSNLYGTTNSGGSSGCFGGCGTVFKLTPTGIETVLYSFFAGGNTDGLYPFAGVIADTSGNLYGTTDAGGAHGYGTVFKVTPTGTETVLYSFAGGSTDGAYPTAGLIADSSGNLYGTTQVGGSRGCYGSGCGTVFKVTPTGAETVLYAFAGGSTDGAYPIAGLIVDTSGNLYGTTEEGGAYGLGTVFKLTPTGTETVLYSFAGGNTDGAFPIAGLIADASGNLYGTTQQGGTYGYGTVFKVTPTGAETVLHSFAGGSTEGAYPYAGLIADASGNLYGTTSQGGGSGCYGSGCGLVFKLAGSGFVPPKAFAGIPGTANCIGESISSLAHTYGGIAHAAAALGYASVTALQNAVVSYCG